MASGGSTWLSQGTPIGAKYGSSRNQTYLTAGSAAGASSLTTYTFSRSTPTTGWAFALGDIDADRVKVTATAPDGSAVSASDLGFRGGFNYCEAGLAGKPSCSGSSPVIAGDVAQWDPVTQALTGNAAGADTQGAAGWFEPTQPLATLTFEFSVRSGIPIYQTWFTSLARDITGAVTDVDGGSVEDIVIDLTDADGSVIASTTTVPGGGYTFVGIQATSGYSVSVRPPAQKTADVQTRPIDLSAADGLADFSIRDLRPVSVSGAVRDTDGDAVAGAVLSVGDPATTVTSAADGAFTFDDVAPGSYDMRITVPSGYTVVSEPPAFTIDPTSEAPVTGQDFVLELAAVPAPAGTIAGTVRDTDGAPVAGAVINVVGDGVAVGTTSAPDGTFRISRLPLGDYEVTLTAPDGFLVDGESTQTVRIDSPDTTLDLSFAVSPEPDPTPSIEQPSNGSEGAIPAAEGIQKIPATGGEFPTALLTLGAGFTAIGALVLVAARRRRQGSARAADTP